MAQNKENNEAVLDEIIDMVDESSIQTTEEPSTEDGGISSEETTESDEKNQPEESESTESSEVVTDKPTEEIPEEPKEDYKVTIISKKLTREDIEDLNFVELQRVIRANQININSLEDAKVMVDAMSSMFESTKDLFEMADQFKKGHESSEEGVVDYSDFIKLPKEFKANYDANKPILEENIKLVEEVAKEKFGMAPKTSSFYSAQLKEALENQMNRILNSPDENKKFTIPKTTFTEKEKNALRSLKNSIAAVEDRPTMIYIFSHCTNKLALINTWKAVKKDYNEADRFIRKYCMETMNFHIAEFNAVVRFFTMYAGTTFISRMMLYQIARVIKHGKHDGTDMYARLFLMNIADYAFKRYDYDTDRLDEVMKSISFVYNQYVGTPKGNATIKAYTKLPIFEKDKAFDKEIEESLKKAVIEVEKEHAANSNGRGMTAPLTYFEVSEDILAEETTETKSE